ncbi:Ankyrin domain containing protein [Diaporthe eres]|nr:Ankyrin domain containing protein [Diaporthe eres]
MIAALGLHRASLEVLKIETNWEGDSAMACLDDSLGWTGVHITALLGNTVLLRDWDTCLPDFDIDVQDANGMTALHWSCAAGRRSTIELLVSCTADCDAKDKWGRTPVDLVAGEDSARILGQLTRGGLSSLPDNTILSRGINFPCWRSCDSCDTLFQHGDLFLRTYPL